MKIYPGKWPIHFSILLVLTIGGRKLLSKCPPRAGISLFRAPGPRRRNGRKRG